MDLKDQNSYYLHPDFQEIDINKIKKKPSPLALLAQTCKNIGTSKESKGLPTSKRNFPENSTVNGIKKSSKRCQSDCSSSSSSYERDQAGNKRIKMRTSSDSVGKSHCDRITKEDAAPKTSKDSLIANLLQIFKSNSPDLTDTDKVNLLNFLMEKSIQKDETTSLLTHVNINNHSHAITGFHPDPSEELHSRNKTNEFPPTFTGSSQYMDQCGEKTSTIKYCMYCGRLIPVLPMLLAHIQIEHNNSGFTGFSLENGLGSSSSNMYNSVMKFNQCMSLNQTKSDQSISFLTDYINSSFKGLSNLIC